MHRPVQQRVRIGLAGAVSLAASIALAFVAQHPGLQPGLVAALAPVLAIAAYVGGMTAASAAAFVLRARGVGLVAVVWVLALTLTRMLVEPGVALEAVGHLPPDLMQRWTDSSNAVLWFVAVPVDVVFGAASCGAVIATLATGSHADPAGPTPLRWGVES
jgi:hypothetical protein